MKKVLLSVLVVGLMAGAADAAQLGLQFQGGGNFVEAAPSDMVWIDVFLTLRPSDSVSAVGFAVAPLPIASSVADAAWTDQTNPGFFGVFPTAAPIHNGGPGDLTILVGSFDVHVDGQPSDLIEITVVHNTVAIFDQTGTQWTYGPMYAGSFNNYWEYAPYGSEGTASPYGNQARDPLTIHVVPEPASLALLALGGFALIRRRR